MTEPNADQIVVAGNGQVYVGPKNDTGLPTAIEDISTLGVADNFAQLGFVSENGATFTDSKNIEDIPVWQSFYPARRVVTGKDCTVAFALREWHRGTVSLAFGGGEFTVAGTGVKYAPPGPEEVDERSMVIAWQDGVRNYALVIPKGMVTEAVETNLTRASAADLPITFGATPNAGTDAWYLLTDDAAFASGS